MKKVIILCILWIIGILILFYISYPTKQKVVEEPNVTEKIVKVSAPVAKEIVTKRIAEKSIFYAEKYNLPIYIVYALEETESDFREDADSKKNPSNGRGIIQVSDIARQEYNNYHSVKFDENDMYNIDKNLEVGLWYFDRIRTHYLKNNCDFTDVYIAYNVGPNYFKKHRDELYSGIYKGEKYNALDRWTKYLTKYYSYFKL